MDDSPQLIGGALLRDLREARRRVLAQPAVADLISDPRFLVPNRQFVRVTGNSFSQNAVTYWPGVVSIVSHTDQSVTDLGTCFASDVNGELLEVGKYYEACEDGERTMLSENLPRPCFVTNVICCGGGSTAGDCNSCTDGQIVGSPVFLRVLNVQEFDVTDNVGQLRHPAPEICLPLTLCTDFNSNGTASISATGTMGQTLNGPLSILTTFSVSRISGVPLRFSASVVSEFFINGASAGVSLSPSLFTTSDCNLTGMYRANVQGTVVDFPGTHRLQWTPVYSIDGNVCPSNPFARGVTLQDGMRIFVPVELLPENQFPCGGCG